MCEDNNFLIAELIITPLHLISGVNCFVIHALSGPIKIQANMVMMIIAGIGWDFASTMIGNINKIMQSNPKVMVFSIDILSANTPDINNITPYSARERRVPAILPVVTSGRKKKRNA
ncbi:hypothetical protein RLOatenuis_4000 [Rickettsiales bacterium]|nr:hypothetical protein RLOatenuis_4000 [Rickettsiales bacterium]